MGGLVGEERELGQDDAERARDQQLPPGGAEEHEAGDRSAERGDQDAAHHVVEAGASTQQAEVADRLEQRRVLARRVRLVAARHRPDDAGNGFRRSGGLDCGHSVWFPERVRLPSRKSSKCSVIQMP